MIDDNITTSTFIEPIHLDFSSIYLGTQINLVF